jgi:hypothetical protein
MKYDQSNHRRGGNPHRHVMAMNMIPIALALVMIAGMAVASEPEPVSTPVTAVVPDFNRMQKWNRMHGDTADPFWADDDNLYHFTCDGRGFGTQRRNLCLSKLTGPSFEQLDGVLVNSMDEYGKADETGPDGATWKISGQECIDGVFYGFVERNIYGNKSKDPLMRQTSFNASLIKSGDRGLTWTRSAKENYDSPMWPGSRFGGPGFIHYGKDGGRVARDKADRFVYAVSNNGFWNGGDDLILGRVARTDLPKLNAADWSYYAGGDGMADSSWTADPAKAKLLLDLPSKLGWTSPCFIPALNRYLLVSWYVTPTLKKWFEPGVVTYDFYQAAHPWGPWTFVSSFDDRFLATGHMYGPNLCAKYQEQEGGNVRIQLFTSGCPFKDEPTGLYKMWSIPLTLKTGALPASTLVNDDDPAIRYTGNWTAGTKRGYHDYQDDVHYTNTTGDAAEYSFTGTGIELLSEKFSDQGSIDIFIDGKPHGSADLKQEKFPRLAQVRVFSAQGLPPGRHTIRIVNAGPGYVAIDAFAVSK